ncbi:hypothetical protein FRC12_012694, partial [Ceratobasidium sp. 428]
DKGKGKENDAFTGLGLRPGAEGISARTGTRFVMTSPPTPSGSRNQKPLPKLDPVLAALERGSKLKSKSICLNCGKKGNNYPCCPRCGEAWCSRECRVEANNGGKHVSGMILEPGRGCWSVRAYVSMIEHIGERGMAHMAVKNGELPFMVSNNSRKSRTLNPAGGRGEIFR